MNGPAAHAEARRQRVVLVGSPVVDVVVRPVQAELEKRGVEASYLEETAFRENGRKVLRDADILYCPGALPVSSHDLADAPFLRAIVSVYTGTDGIDEEAATARNILIANGQVPENTESMAEAAILLMLAASYDLSGAERAMTPGGAALPRRAPRLLRGKTVGLIGFGEIGRAVAARLEPWGVTLLISTPRPRAPFPPGAAFVSLEELLARADVTCLTAPLRPETENLLSRERLAGTKPGSLFVNISRGQLVDEQALFDLAKSGHFSAIALDVFATEPLPEESPLRTLPNAILTPHALGHTVDSKDGIIRAGVENICRALSGERPLYVRNQAILPRWQAQWAGSPRTEPS